MGVRSLRNSSVFRPSIHSQFHKTRSVSLFWHCIRTHTHTHTQGRPSGSAVCMGNRLLRVQWKVVPPDATWTGAREEERKKKKEKVAGR